MVDKLVVFKLLGNLRSQGFRVIVEIAKNQQGFARDECGDLPPSPELADAIAHYWQQEYGSVLDRQVRAMRPGNLPYGGSISDKIASCKRAGTQLSALVNDWLASAPLRRALDSLQQQIQPEEEIHFSLRLEDALLCKLPWETWKLFEDYPKSQYSFSSLRSSAPQKVPRPPNKRKVRILAILGFSPDINVEADLKALEQLSDIAEIVPLCEPRGEQIRRELWAEHWDIIFFAGHSYTEGEAGVLHINPNETLPIQPDSELWFGLKTAVSQGLQLVIFNSCDGFGLAKQLDDLHVPQIVFMREFVVDFAAQKFLQDFLRAYIRGSSLQLAVREAKEKLRGLKVKIDGRDEEFEIPYADWLPVIWQNPAVFPLKWEELAPKAPKRAIAPPRSRRKAAAASLAATALVVGARSLGLLFPWEMQAYDAMMRQSGEPLRDSSLLLVTIDDLDILEQKERGMRPVDSLADEALLQWLEMLEPYQPSAIGVNVVRDGPVALPKLQKRYQNDDRLFASCAFASPPMQTQAVAPPPGVPRDRQSFANILRDRDGVARRYILYRNARFDDPCQGQYALGTDLAIRHLQDLGLPLSFSGPDLKLGTTSFKRLQGLAGAYQGRDLGAAQILLDYRLRSPEIVSLRDILAGKVPLERVKGRMVLLGIVTGTKVERYRTPERELADSYLHARAASQLVSATLGEREQLAPPSGWLDLAWIAGWAFCGGLGMVCRPRHRFQVLGLSLVVLSAGSYGLFLKGTWIAVVPAAIALGVSSGLAIAPLPENPRLFASTPPIAP